MAKANVADQKLQAVLYIMGADLGKSGIDGDSGPKTYEATRKAADKIYSSMASGMSNSEAISTVLKGDVGSREHMRQVVTDKLKDPAFRAAALEKLKEMPQTRDTIIAMQTILVASGHDPLTMRDPVTGLMSGNMNAATKFALDNTVDGKPNATAYAALGLNRETIQLAMNGGGGALSQSYNVAAVGITPEKAAPQAPRQQVALVAAVAAP